MIESLLPCPGCEELPTNIGNMGRHKYSCINYHRRDATKCTPLCIANIVGPMWKSETEACAAWNREVRHEFD